MARCPSFVRLHAPVRLSLFVLVGVAVCSTLALANQDPRAQASPAAHVIIDGNTTFSRDEILDRLGVIAGGPLPRSPEALAEALQRLYVEADYTAATVTGDYDPHSHTLELSVDEGVIEQIAFEGPDEETATRFQDEFDVRAGDVFNQRQVARALDRLLDASHGAFKPVSEPGSGQQKPGAPFDLNRVDGRRVLLVRLMPRTGRFGLTFGTASREDWFSAVDGLAPAAGFDVAIFDRRHFNHLFLSGYVSYKVARESLGYSMGFERPIFEAPRLYVGAEVHDTTASDDFWRLSANEQSLVAVTFKNSFRDYYRRRGIQVNGVVRVHSQHELSVSWRGEHHDTLTNETDFSVFKGDDSFRPGFVGESLGETYHRHQLDSPYGSSGDEAPGFRVNWTVEVASPSAFGGDFDFTRQILNARSYLRLSPHQSVNTRVVGGVAAGNIPPLRAGTGPRGVAALNGARDQGRRGSHRGRKCARSS